MRNLALSKIRIDGGTQPRVELDEDVVADYAEKMAANVTMPPVVVFFDGSHYWLADGFHRYMAAKRNNIDLITCDVQTGAKRDAILYAVGANAEHGLPRTNADKRRAVEMLLNDPEWSQWSNREIARKCHVHNSSVDKYREQLSASAGIRQISEPRKVQRGNTIYTQRTENIGKTQKAETHDASWGEFTSAPKASSNDTHAANPNPSPAPLRKEAGIGIACAHEAINALKRIPINDALRGEGFQMVAQWIDYNLGRKAA